MVVTSLLLILNGCRSTGASDLTAKASSPLQSPSSFVAGLDEERIHSLPVVTPLEVFRQLGERPGPHQIKFIAQMLENFYMQSVSVGMGDVLNQTFGVHLQDNPRFAINGPLEQSVYEDWAKQVYLRLERNPDRINMFPTLRLEHIPPAQSAAFVLADNNTGPVASRPYPRDRFDSRIFHLRTSGCVAQDSSMVTTSVSEDLGIYRAKVRISDGISDCYHHNSEQLAEILNRLANTIVGDELDILIRTDGEPVATVRSYRELLRYLNGMTDQYELFNTRSFVDFQKAVFTTDGNTYQSIRMPLWFTVRVDDRDITLPAEHGELNLAFIRNGTRFAQVRYYLGLPSADHEGIASYWRAHVYKDFAWYGTHHEFIQIHNPAGTANLELWLSSVAHTMRGLQTVIDQYNPPYSSYGTFVCTDSMTLAIAKYDSLNDMDDARLTYAFPAIRAHKVMLPPQDDIDLDKLVASASSMNPEFLHQRYPSDLELFQTDPAAFAKRVKEAFSRLTPQRYKHFPEVREAINSTLYPDGQVQP